MFAGLRKNAKIVIYIIAGVFILSMAIGGIAQIFIPKNYVGIIAKETIDAQQFEIYLTAQYRDFYEANPNESITEQKTIELNNAAWNRLTQSIILNKAIKKRRIKVSTDDVVAKLQDPPEYIKAMEQFQTDGNYDAAKYIQMLNENDQFASYLENSIRSSLPMEKLYESVKAEVIITEEDVREDYIKTNDKADAKIIYFNPNNVKDLVATEEEEKQFYEDNKEDYKREPARKYKYVQLKLTPSEADKAAVKVTADDICRQIADGLDFVKAAEQFSQGPSAPRGGDLGKFTHGKMVKEFSDAAFALEIDEISKPVLSQFGWHIITIYEKGKNDEGEEEVAARHILLKTEASEETKANMSVIANDIYEAAKKGDMDKVAEDFAVEAKETREFYEDGKYISGIGQNPELVKFAFSHKKGAMPELIEQENGEYLIAKLSLKVGEHYLDFTEVQSRIKNSVLKEKKIVEVKKQAAKFAASYMDDQYLEKAEAEGWKVIEAVDIKIDGNIEGISKDEELNEAILTKEEGESTGVVSTEKAAYIALIAKRVKPDMVKFETDKEKLTTTLTERKETDHLNKWYMQLTEDANIIDNREKFYSL